MPTEYAPIPMRRVGPITIRGPVLDEAVMVPLATFEKPLWPSTARGARVTGHAGGITAVVTDERMTRSIMLHAPDALAACRFVEDVRTRFDALAAVVAETGRFVRLLDLHAQIVADTVWFRLEMSTGDAAGHNMVTLAADRVMTWLLDRFPTIRYGSISGNYCTDKKTSAVNGILGRGRHTIAEVRLTTDLCRRFLKTTPEKIARLNTDKNLTGSILAGSLRSANAHFANMLLAFYLATGQDAANIVEGSQGITTARLDRDTLYFAVTLPHCIVGAVGNGKEHRFAHDNLRQLGCLDERPPGGNARRLAAIAAATVLCGELSLLAAQTNPGELMAAHLRLERQ